MESSGSFYSYGANVNFHCSGSFGISDALPVNELVNTLIMRHFIKLVLTLKSVTFQSRVQELIIQCLPMLNFILAWIHTYGWINC